MDFDEYQKKAKKYDYFEPTDNFLATGFMEKALGLTGEAGEVADKIKKILRDKDGSPSEDDVIAIKKELGDTLWYLATVARYLEIPLSEVAEGNLDKLEDRWKRGKIRGEGDER